MDLVILKDALRDIHCSVCGNDNAYEHGRGNGSTKSDIMCPQQCLWCLWQIHDSLFVHTTGTSHALEKIWRLVPLRGRASGPTSQARIRAMSSGVMPGLR